MAATGAAHCDFLVAAFSILQEEREKTEGKEESNFS